jgi:hypothetical protein
MNIFEILSAGNRVLKEEHISAVLGWMLDPYHDHGLGMELLKRLSQTCFGEDASISKVLAAGEFSGLVMRDRSRLKIHTELEVTVRCKAGNERSIDILITINDNIVLAIENKTSRGSIQDTQLQEEVEGLNEAFRDRNGNQLYFLFLTPSGAGPTADKAMSRIGRDLCSAEPIHILWKKDERESDKAPLSIAELLNGILLDEAVGRTSPLSSETKFLIKSFIRFIENDFSYFQGAGSDNGGKYYAENLTGLDTVRRFFDQQDPKQYDHLFIGFQNGIGALEEKLKSAMSNEDERSRLENRRYKLAYDNSSNHKKSSNWLPIRSFIEMLDKYPF